MDRLSQLQDSVDKISELFYTCVGITQRDAPLKMFNSSIPIEAWTQSELDSSRKTSQAFNQNIVNDIIKTSKRIDFLIDQLPGITQSEQEQVIEIQQLQQENILIGKDLKIEMEKAQNLLDKVESIHFDLIQDVKKEESHLLNNKL